MEITNETNLGPELRYTNMLGASYCSALDSIFCSLVILNQLGAVVYTNPSTKKLLNKLGIDVEKLLSMAWEKVDIIRGSGFYKISSGEVHINIAVYPMTIDDVRSGSTLVFHESLNDTCQLPEMYHALSKLEDINIYLECSYDGIMVVDEKGVTIRVNSALERQLGVPRQHLLGRNVRDNLAEGLYPQSVSLKVLESHKTETVAMPINDRQLVATGTPVFASPGKISAVMVNLRDMTDLNNTSRELSRQRMLAEGYVKELCQANKRQSSPDMVAASKEMQNILDMVYAISDVDPTVLITGESGTGKEVIADQIHRTSHRRDHPIIKVNCGAIPSSLFESEFFGYEDGAFTGASKKGKVGFFELANGGTILLDEIGEIPLDLQVKLLRVIQESEVTRVGGTETIKVDVRIISATNRDIWKLVQEGRFRRDLYYRINVINIEIPPLRKRRDDIIPLAVQLLERCNKKYHKQKTLSLELAKTLRTLDWLGNVRELQYLIENIALLSPNDVLNPAELPDRYRINADEDNQVIVRGILPLKEVVRQAEQQAIQNAREKFSTTAEIAAALGVDRTTISRKLGELLHG